jgi:hypothetical protein
LLICMDSQERNADINGIRNSPSAGSQLLVVPQSTVVKKFHFGVVPRFRPRKLKSISFRA